MKRTKLLRIAAGLLLCIATLPCKGQNIKNPVLPGVADAGVIKFNGRYYIGGVYTNGAFYVSDDLVNWKGPVPVFSMENDWIKGGNFGNDQIHANDMSYINGTFHLYWSVNYWGKDKHAVHIGHAVSDSISGPYREPVKDTWLDNRIDPHLFRDDDGKLYLYMVKFTDGNTIWARPMKDPSTFAGEAIYQFASLPGTWETIDNRVAEGPWVIKYRNRYYMMYNANDTGPSIGNYQLGVAEAGSPAGFNHGSKYPYPVMGSNQTVLEDTCPDLLRNAPGYRKSFSYTFYTPAEGWQYDAFSDASWKKGEPGFASHKIVNSSARPFGSEWKGPQIYLRARFRVAAKQTGNLALRITHDGDTRVYLNGRLIYDKAGADYCIVNLDARQAALSDGENLLAAESKSGRQNYIDVSLFDMKDGQAGDILFTPGQPNLLRGPNGFEWWLVYMANKNRERRSQYINRVHFFDKTLYAEGISSGNTPGYFPPPTRPTYRDTLPVSATGASQIRLKESWDGTAYLIEAGINATDEAGLIPYVRDDKNWIKTGLRRQGNVWYFGECINGDYTEEAFALPAGFRFGVYHTIRIERNGTVYTVRIDEIPAPGKSVFQTSSALPCTPALFSAKGESLFAGIAYTRGWDETDDAINGWGSSSAGTASQGVYTVRSTGLQVAAGDFEAFKGDLLPQYEFSLQVSNPFEQGAAGMYPIYMDAQNYVKAGLDYANRRLCVQVRQKGKTVFEKTYPLEQRKPLYADMTQTDFIEKRYTFPSPARINALFLNRTVYGNPQQSVENMFSKVSVEYLWENKWRPITGTSQPDPSHPGLSRMDFQPVRAEALRFTNRQPDDLQSYIYRIQVNQLSHTSYNLRAVKTKDAVRLFVDGKETATIPAIPGKSQVGLFSTGCRPSFNGLMLYEIPELK
ncbi:MAG: family 43 glycosylhydrolase [Tannerellaceae bacterium]|jgi:GH43 family beta-xylosidase/regulation of enolase protein 1 (concanavalin A-like superfamily)|nr:family 43 glycosylhydrolase [Tannerellaceae bacterium]